MKAFAGKILYVDLSSGKIETKPLQQPDVEQLIGGAGINAELAMENIAPGCDPLSPENALIYGVGTFAGTTVPGAARTVVSAKSPITRLYGTSAAGHFGPMLKFAGYDHVVITGRSPRPVYLNIVDDHVTLEDASALWGKDIFEFTDHIWSRDPEAWVSCIGPAGENMVSYAAIVQNKYSTYGSCGLGAVMGSKNLKGLVARGSGQIELDNPSKFLRLAREAYDAILDAPYVPIWRELGTLIQFQPQYAGASAMPITGQQFSMDEWTKSYKGKLWSYPTTCPSCPIGCKGGLKIREGKRAGSEFSITCPVGTLTLPFVDLLGVPAGEPEEAARCAELANRLGLSTTAGLTDMVEWACQLYEQGAITKADTGGYEIVKGSAGILQRLMLDIAHRRGIGDLLADTPPEIQRRLGGRADSYTMHKGWLLGKAFGGPRWGPKTWTSLFFGYVVDPRGHGPSNAYSSVTYTPGRPPAVLRRYAQRIGVPESELDAVLTGEVDGYDVPSFTKAVELYNLVLYSVGSCQRPFVSKALDVNTIAALYSAATGLTVTAHDLLERAERILTLQRLFNIREGLTKEQELYPKGYLSSEDEGELNNLLSRYYALHGWNPDTGVPERATISMLGVARYAPADQGQI